MIRAALLSLCLLAVPAFAQNSAISISCGDCNPFQAIQVLLDGADIQTNASVRIIDIAPGQHEVKVVKWVSPFATDVLFSGVVNFPPNIELRAKATKDKLDIYGRGPYTAPVTGPSGGQVAAARSSLGEAKEYLEELKERVEDGDDACSAKVSGRLGALEDALADATNQTDRGMVDFALGKAVEAQKVVNSKCGRRTAQKWARPMDRVVARLQAASRAL